MKISLKKEAKKKKKLRPSEPVLCLNEVKEAGKCRSIPDGKNLFSSLKELVERSEQTKLNNYSLFA